MAMSTTPDYMYKMSEALSEVMNDIGVNKKLVMERRRSCFLREALLNLTVPVIANICTSYVVGSQIEGSTTIGLDSDWDMLSSDDKVNVIQHMSEWKPGSRGVAMMIQNENISPGYCYLHVIFPRIPFPILANDTKLPEKTVIDSEERILLMNTAGTIPESYPAITRQGIPGTSDADTVLSYYCKSSPFQAAPWLQKLTESKWPSEDDKTFCRNAGCFLVHVGSKLSDMPKLEWRISTSLQERRLMLRLKITQVRCYVLMKMIIKTHINPRINDVLSSFMCKNVLLYCVYNSSHESSQEWHTGNLLSYLHLCLFMLKECILQRNCPHLMIPENNLLAGRMTDAQRGKLLDIIENLMADKEDLLYKIQIDNLGTRLRTKLNPLFISPELPSAADIAADIITTINIQIASQRSDNVQIFLMKMYSENLEETQHNMYKSLSALEKNRAEGNSIQKTACGLLIPLVKSALGSVMASISIDAQTAISDEAFTYLEALKKESDVLLGRLRLVSVLYCTGDIERAECELKFSQQLCNMPITMSLNCGSPRQQLLYNQCGEAIKFLVTFCTRFLNNEINCVPHELRYEILKSYIEEDRKMRTEEDSMWMNHITVNSVIYVYFLQYKTYGRLQRRTEQLEAIRNLNENIDNPNYKETSLNLLGQCCEQENLQAVALECYKRSIQHRERNNAARFLMCIQLLKRWKKYYV